MDEVQHKQRRKQQQQQQNILSTHACCLIFYVSTHRHVSHRTPAVMIIILAKKKKNYNGFFFHHKMPFGHIQIIWCWNVELTVQETGSDSFIPFCCPSLITSLVCLYGGIIKDQSLLSTSHRNTLLILLAEILLVTKFAFTLAIEWRRLSLRQYHSHSLLGERHDLAGLPRPKLLCSGSKYPECLSF